MLQDNFTISTDTATICIYDPAMLVHRFDSPPDWWSDYRVELEEANSGNLLIIGLGEDGDYYVRVQNEITDCIEKVTGLIRIKTGRIFIGPGEEITGGGYRPINRSYVTGSFIDLPPSTYRVTI